MLITWPLHSANSLLNTILSNVPDGIIDGERKHIISPQKLCSKKFEDKAIAISTGVKPIVKDKMFAYKVYPNDKKF